MHLFLITNKNQERILYKANKYSKSLKKKKILTENLCDSVITFMLPFLDHSEYTGFHDFPQLGEVSETHLRQVCSS